MFLPPLMGATVIFHATLKPADVLATLKRERVSVLVGVPRILQSLKEKIERDASEDGGRVGFEQQFADARDKNPVSASVSILLCFSEYYIYTLAPFL